MTHRSSDNLADRKAALIAKAELDRLSVAFAAQQFREWLTVPRDDAGVLQSRLLAARVLAVAVPLVGTARTRRVLRILSLALAAYRFVRNLRRRA